MNKIRNNQGYIKGKSKKIYMKWLVYVLLIILLFFVIVGIPIIINEMYKSENGYTTLWGASEVLSYYSAILSGLITIGALIATIRYNNNNMEKQIKFNMSQIKSPFFILDKVQIHKDNIEFEKNENNWARKFRYEIEGNKIIIDDECCDIEAVLVNIGDGIALDPHYHIHSDSRVRLHKQIVRNNDYVILTYDLKNDLYERQIKNELLGFQDEKYELHMTLSYQNTLGIDFLQTIPILITISNNKQLITICVCEASPQTF